MKHIVINIGRQFGAGGLAVAKVIGEKLGISVYDNELLRKAASESGLCAEVFKEKDEEIDRFSISSILSISTGNYINDADLFNIQSDAIRDIAESGSAVIVGRCSDYVLRDMEYCLNVFLTSPEDVRAERVSQRCAISKEDAGELVEKKDKKREDYYNYHTYGNWGVASNYDLCIDSSILGIEGTADFIIDFAKRKGLL